MMHVHTSTKTHATLVCVTSASGLTVEQLAAFSVECMRSQTLHRLEMLNEVQDVLDREPSLPITGV